MMVDLHFHRGYSLRPQKSNLLITLGIISTPAMAAGLTDHVWTLREVLLYRVPPWPQAQTG